MVSASVLQASDSKDRAAAQAPEAALPRRRRLSVRAYLLLLAITVLLPLLLLAGLLTLRAVEAERARAQQAIAATAGGVLTVVTREVSGLIETLQTVETSPSLAAGDLRAFHQQITDLARTIGVHVVLRDPTGRTLASSLTPLQPEASAVVHASALDPRLLAERQVLVDGLSIDTLSGTPVFAVAMAVHRDGAARYLLHLNPPAARLRDALVSLNLDPVFRVAVLDGDGMILARSHDHAAGVGRRAALPAALDAAAGQPVRLVRGSDHDGRAVYFHVTPAQHGWTIVTSVAAAQVDEPRRDLLMNAGLAAVLLTGSALLAARMLGTRLATSIRGLAEAASRLDRGATPALAPSGIREIDEVAGTLALAGDRLRAAAAQREEAAERQRLVLHELNHRVKNTLAMVQALAALAARGAPDVATYRDRLTERLNGLARTQALLTASDWTGAQVEELLRAELGMYEAPPRAGATAVPGAATGAPMGVPLGMPLGGGRIALVGPPVVLPAHHVVAFGMLAHELATNAAKYGALSLPQGRLTVRWTVTGTAPGERGLELDWEESGGPPVVPPATPGFGTRMIERGLARQLGAEVSSSWLPEGLRFRLRMRLDAGGEGEATGLSVIAGGGIT